MDQKSIFDSRSGAFVLNLAGGLFGTITMILLVYFLVNSLSQCNATATFTQACVNGNIYTKYSNQNFWTETGKKCIIDSETIDLRGLQIKNKELEDKK